MTNVFPFHPVLLTARFYSDPDYITFSHYASSYVTTYSHDIRWRFKSYIVIEISNVVIRVITQSFNTVFCKINILKEK